MHFGNGRTSALKLYQSSVPSTKTTNFRDQNALIFNYDKRILVRKIHNLCPMHTWLASFKS